MEEQNKITEQPNQNFDEDLDKFDKEHEDEVHEEDESKGDEVQLKPKKKP